ncbi:hypothetical protein AAZX31_11G077500 [Glycine max]
MEARAEIKVRMQCECTGCDRKVEKMKKSVQGMEGVAQVQVDREEQGNCKLTVIGRVDPNHVLKALRRLTHKKVELLPVPQVQDDVVPQPSQPEPVNVHNVLRHDHDDQEASMLPRANFLGDPNYTTAFSEDSPNACPIM